MALSSRLLLRNNVVINKLCGALDKHYAQNVRTMLSDAYICNNQWQSRLSSTVLKSLNMDKFYTDLNLKFNEVGHIDAIDLDLFANNVKKEDQIYELEDLLHRFRRTPKTIELMASTSHAVIKSYLEFDKTEALLKVLQDKNNYGIFPDTFSYNLLFNHFIKMKNFKGAVDLAVLMMLQEDGGDDISKVFALYACHKYVTENSLAAYVKPEVVEEEVDEDEIKWVRVHFLRPECYDDHFDIENETLLVGKTLWMFGKLFQDIVGYSYQLLGLAMYQKWDKLIKLLDQVLQSSDIKLSESMVEKCKVYMSEDKEINADHSQIIQDKLSQLKSSDKLSEDNIDILVEKKLSDLKSSDLVSKSNQGDVYEKWTKEREELLQKQITEFIKQQKIKEIIAKKKKLKEKEELLFFFENYKELQKEIPEEVEDSEKKASKFDDDYEVPEMPHPGFKSDSSSN